MKMKAVVLIGNGLLQVEKIDIPDLEPDECRIAIRAVGICSSDIPRAYHNHAYYYPLVMGHEIAGEIVDCGSAVSDKHRVGDHVTVFPLIPCGTCPQCNEQKYAQCVSYSYYGSRKNGGYAEYLNVREWNLLSIPKYIEFTDAALIEPIAVVKHAIDRSGILMLNKPGNIAIIGGGFLGLMAVELLKILKPEIKVTIIDRNQYKLDIASDLGASTVCLKTKEDWNSYVEKHANSYITVFEATGIPNLFCKSIELTKAHGTVLWMGNISGDLKFSQGLVSSILRKELKIKGTWNSTYNGMNDSDWVTVRNLLTDGLKPSKIVSKIIMLEEVPELIRCMNAHKERTQVHKLIKVVVKV